MEWSKGGAMSGVRSLSLWVASFSGMRSKAGIRKGVRDEEYMATNHIEFAKHQIESEACPRD